MQNLTFTLCWLALLFTTEGGTRVLTFVHQPLTTLGTEMDAGIVVARVPVLMSAVSEGLLFHVASPNKILQDVSAGIADSNILSLLSISLSVHFVDGARYTVIMDLSRAGDPAEHGVTMDEVVASTIDCINKTIIDTNLFHSDSQQVVWSLEFKANPKMLSGLEKYQQAYEPHFKGHAEPGAEQPVTRPEPEPQGGDKPQPESEGRSR